MQLNLAVQAALAAGLIIIMFGIGLSLTRQDFLNVFGQVIAANALGVCSISTIVKPLESTRSIHAP
jgi:predicted Na+-dependent transporter